MAETRAGPKGNAVGLSQAIPFPGKLSLRGQVTDQRAGAAYERMQAVLQEVSRQTRTAYADYYLAGKSLGTNAQTTELMSAKSRRV
jgi:cobalt-zinc-cadmium efflux system outer membrane protein